MTLPIVVTIIAIVGVIAPSLIHLRNIKELWELIVVLSCVAAACLIIGIMWFGQFMYWLGYYS